MFEDGDENCENVKSSVPTCSTFFPKLAPSSRPSTKSYLPTKDATSDFDADDLLRSEEGGQGKLENVGMDILL